MFRCHVPNSLSKMVERHVVMINIKSMSTDKVVETSHDRAHYTKTSVDSATIHQHVAGIQGRSSIPTSTSKCIFDVYDQPASYEQGVHKKPSLESDCDII